MAWRERIIKRLANHDRLNDITQEVCEKTGLYWSAAEALVREVALMQEKTVRRKRSPTLIGLALATLVGGVGLIVTLVFTIWVGSLGMAMVIGSWFGLRDGWADWLH